MNLTKQDVHNAIAALLAELSNLNVDYDKGFNENGINSVLLVKIFVRLEEMYQIEFEEHDFDGDSFQSIDSFAAYLTEKINNLK